MIKRINDGLPNSSSVFDIIANTGWGDETLEPISKTLGPEAIYGEHLAYVREA
jgi:hypothetical protein